MFEVPDEASMIVIKINLNMSEVLPNRKRFQNYEVAQSKGGRTEKTEGIP